MLAYSCQSPSCKQGLSIVEVIIVSALTALVFGALFAGYLSMQRLLDSAGAKAGAVALSTERMEYFRSVGYDQLGTIGGVPAGVIPQYSTTTLNGVTFVERVLVQFIDDPADGTGAADSNGILADYKQIKAEYTWEHRGIADTFSMTSNVVPPGIETTAGGGTIRVNVFDATVTPVVGADVRFYNETTTTTINTLRTTDVNGVAMLAGAPAASNYEIFVSDAGYSTDQTYRASSSNPNPITPPIAVVAGQVSTMNFQIDELSDVSISTLREPTMGSFADTFVSDVLLSAQASTSVSGGAVELVADTGVHRPTGIAVSTSTVPTSLDRWYDMQFQASTTASTSVRVSVLYNNGSDFVLIPNGDLSGNSAGYSTSPIDLSGLDVSTYDELALQATLTTTDGTETPQLHSWQLRHVSAQLPEPNIDISLRATTKVIGTDAGGQPIPKYQAIHTTDGNGELTLSDIEWDLYDIGMVSSGVAVLEMCPHNLVNIEPGDTTDITFTLGSATPQLLRVIVTNSSGAPISGASVRLENTGVDETKTTSLCGQTYFTSGLYDASDYTVTVSHPGYATNVTPDVTVSSTSTVAVGLN